jgi:hypothetical protein
MKVFLLLVALVIIGLWLARRRRSSLSLWWTRTAGPYRPWLSRTFGATPTFGTLQRAVLADAIRQRTVSVTGSVWLPAQLIVDIAEADQEAIEHAPGPFLTDIAEALTALAAERGWRVDGAVTLWFADEPTAKPGLPRVSVAALGPVAGIGATAAAPAVAPDPATLPPRDPALVPRHPTAAPAHRAPTPAPAALPPTVPYGLPETRLEGGTELIHTAGGRVPVRGLLLDPEEGEGPPIVLGGADAATIIGRTSPADVLVTEPTVSGQHCRIVLSGARWCIEDLGSSNGTLVNGERISGRHELASGDVVGLGRRARYRVHV